MALTKEQIQEADDLRRERVDVPEWAPPDMPAHEAYVFVRTLEGDERDAFEELIEARKQPNGKRNLRGIRATITAWACVDDAGKRIFTEQDADWLGKKSSLALERIFKVACELNGLTKKDVDELEKNSDSAPS